MFECCGARGACQGRDWGHDQDNGRQAREARTLELHFLCQSLISIKPNLLWRKIRFKHLLLLLYFCVTFILFEHKVHSPCEHKVIHGKPLQAGDGLSSSNDSLRPRPGIIMNNSASLLEDAQGGSHSWEVLSRTIKLDILLTRELEYFLEMNIWDFVTFWGLFFMWYWTR